jgi:hypothetical protein
MSAPNQGRQSPPPERQTGAQQQDAPSEGKGVNDQSNNQEESKAQLEVCSLVPRLILFLSQLCWVDISRGFLINLSNYGQ